MPSLMPLTVTAAEIRLALHDGAPEMLRGRLSSSRSPPDVDSGDVGKKERATGNGARCLVANLLFTCPPGSLIISCSGG